MSVATLSPETVAAVNYAVQRSIEARPRPSSVTQRQAAEMLGVSEATVSRFVRQGRLKLNGVGQIPVGEIDRLLVAG